MEEDILKKKEIKEIKKKNKRIIVLGLLAILIIASGVFVYLTFIKDNNSSNETEQEKTDKSWYEEYKTIDGKYTLKITENGELYINNKKIIKEFREEDGKYLLIGGDFDPPIGGISSLTFVLNKEKQLIEEKPNATIEDWENIGSDCGSDYGEYARFYGRCQGFKPVNVGGNYFFVVSSEVVDTVYTTSWKRLGETTSEIKFDKQGIYVCNNYDDNFNCIRETKYDVNGNVLD